MLDLIASARHRADVEGVEAFTPVPQTKLEPDTEMRRMTASAASHFIQPAALVDRVVQGIRQRVTDKVQGVEKIALPDAVLTHESGARRLIMASKASREAAPFFRPNTFHAMDRGSTENLTKNPPPATWL